MIIISRVFVLFYFFGTEYIPWRVAITARSAFYLSPARLALVALPRPPRPPPSSSTAATTSGIFNLGSAECKIAMEGLTTKQMVEYMQVVKANTLRKPTQYLSAAFNLNTEMKDDLILGEDGKPRVLKDRMEIGLRGIELAAMGGFDKVTFDGATLVYPSIVSPNPPYAIIWFLTDDDSALALHKTTQTKPDSQTRARSSLGRTYNILLSRFQIREHQGCRLHRRGWYRNRWCSSTAIHGPRYWYARTLREFVLQFSPKIFISSYL